MRRHNRFHIRRQQQLSPRQGRRHTPHPVRFTHVWLRMMREDWQWGFFAMFCVPVSDD